MTKDDTTPDETDDPTDSPTTTVSDKATDAEADEFFGAAAKAAAVQGENAGKERNDWKYKKQPVLQGRIVQGARFPTNTQKGYAITIEVAELGTDEVYNVWCSGKILEDWIMAEAPAVGTLVYIEFLGKEPVQANPSHHYNNFSVRAQESDFDYWHKIHNGYHALVKAKQEAAGGIQPVKTNTGPEQAPF